MLIKRKSIEAQSNHLEGPRATRSSHAAPITPSRKIKFAPINLSEFEGVRFLHFGSEWVQGAMRLRKPDWIELEYGQQMMAWMLFHAQPKQVAQLGLGAGSLTKFCYRYLPQTQVTAVELNPEVVRVCESMFCLPPNDERLRVLTMDAWDFVRDEAQQNRYDAIQIDLYDATARGPVLDSAEFYQHCADCLTADGVLTVNLFGDHPSYLKNLKALRFAFGTVLTFSPVHDGNVVALAFRPKLKLDLGILQERAQEITRSTKLPAKNWLKDLCRDNAC